MTTKTKIILVILALISRVPAHAEECRVIKTSGPININGRLDEPDWKKAERLDAKQVKTGEEPPKTTWFKAMYDNDNIYLAGYFDDADVRVSIKKDRPQAVQLFRINRGLGLY